MIPLLLLAAFTLSSCADAQASTFQFVGGYWEAWNHGRPDDYSSLLSSVPVFSNTTSGYNLVLLAYSNFMINRDRQNRTTFSFINDQFTSNGTLYDFDALEADIITIREQGAFVLVSVGGSSFTYRNKIKDQADAEKFIADLAEAVTSFGLDGVDFSYFDGMADPILLAYMIVSLKAKLGPASIVMLTIPAVGVYLNSFGEVLVVAGDSLDYVHIAVYDYYWPGYDFESDFSGLRAIGIPPSKTMFGIMPGCHEDSTEFTSVTNTTSYTEYAVSKGMAGVILKSIQRDTDHRSNLTDCLYQTGEADGTYLDAVLQSVVGGRA